MPQLRILIQSISFHPEPTGTGKIIGEMARWLVDQGHAVRIVTAQPHYPQWKVHPGFSAWRYGRERWAQGRGDCWRCPIWVPARPNAMSRLFYAASFCVSSAPAMLISAFWRPDLVMLIEPSLLGAPLALAVAKLSAARSWLNIKDYEVDVAFALGMLRWVPLRRAAAWAESSLMQRFTRVSSISPAMRQRAITKGVAASRAILFRDWVDLSWIRDDPESAAALRRAFGFRADEFVCVYSGNLGVKQGLDVILGAARRLHDNPAIRFLICGEGAMRERLDHETKAIPNLLLRGLVPASELNALLHLADAHLLPQQAGASELVMPSKLLYMLASGRPIVATATVGTEIGDIVSSALGLLTPPGDECGLADAIAALAIDRQRCCAAGAAGRDLAERLFDRNAVLEKFQEQVLSVVRGDGRGSVQTP